MLVNNAYLCCTLDGQGRGDTLEYSLRHAYT